MEEMIMSKTKARKWREKRIREGRRDPSNDRSTFADSDMYKRMATKKTKTKRDKLSRVKYKERLSEASYSDGNDRSFLFVSFTYSSLWFAINRPSLCQCS
jgi:hypothetical protein